MPIERDLGHFKSRHSENSIRQQFQLWINDVDDALRATLFCNEQTCETYRLDFFYDFIIDRLEKILFFFVEATIKFKENGGRSRVHAGFVPTQLRFFPSAPSSFHPDSGRDPTL